MLKRKKVHRQTGAGRERTRGQSAAKFCLL